MFTFYGRAQLCTSSSINIFNVTFLICAAMNAEGKVMKEVMSSQEFISHRLKRKYVFKAIVKGKQVRIRKETNNLALRSFWNTTIANKDRTQRGTLG